MSTFYSVHVSGDSKHHNTPEFKKHLKIHGGELHYPSDKGAAYKFKRDYQAQNFHRGIQSQFKNLSSENDGEVNEEVAVNSVGAGNVAGLQGDPPVRKKKKNVMTFRRFIRK